MVVMSVWGLWAEMTACGIGAEQLVLSLLAVQHERRTVPLFTAKHYHGGLVAVAFCNGCGEIVLLAIVSGRSLWLVALDLEVLSDL